MRTIKVEIESNVGNGAIIRVSTEAVVDDDNAREAGTEAAEAVSEFLEGYGEGQA